MTPEQYYKAPPQKVFNEIKQESIKIWKTYDDQFGYATEKINQIKDLENIGDNAWYMVAMFDSSNQSKLLHAVSDDTADMIVDARGY
jgi:ribosome maturation protein Sdo1